MIKLTRMNSNPKTEPNEPKVNIEIKSRTAKGVVMEAKLKISKTTRLKIKSKQLIENDCAA